MAENGPAGDKKSSLLKRLFGKSRSSKAAQDEKSTPPESSSNGTGPQTESAQTTSSWSSSPSGYNYATSAKPPPLFGPKNSIIESKKKNQWTPRTANGDRDVVSGGGGHQGAWAFPTGGNVGSPGADFEASGGGDCGGDCGGDDGRYDGGDDGGGGGGDDGGGGGGDDGGYDGGDDGGGCIAGDSLIHLASGHEKPIRALRKGDLIFCDAQGTTATVVCVVSIKTRSGKEKMVRFPTGLDITPTHPVLHTAKGWVFPKDLHALGVVIEDVECEEVFDILLDSQHTAIVNGTVCAMLGHHRDGHTKHEFWGNWNTVVDCLKAADPEGFEIGKVKVVKKLRDQNTKRVYGLEGRDGKVGAARQQE